MNAAVAVGRVGGLAVALGVGLALTTGGAVARADDTDTTSSSSAASPPSSRADRAASTGEASGPSGPSSVNGPDTGRTPVSDGSRISVRIARDEAPGNRNRATIPARPRPPKSSPVDPPTERPATPLTRPSWSLPARVATTNAAGAVRISAIAADGTTNAPTIAATVPQPGPPASAGAVSLAPVGPVAVIAETPIAKPAPSIAGGVLSGLLSVFGLGSLAVDSPSAPIGVPAMWGLLAWARREFQRTPAPEAVAPVAATSLAIATVAAAPTTAPVAWLTGSGTMGPYLLPRTTNTAARFGIAGTDLGIMWDNGIADNPATAVNEHQILIAFGDTFSGNRMTGIWRSNTLLRTSDRNPADGITVPAGAVGDIFSGSPLSGPNFSRQIIKSPGYLGFLGSEVTLIPTSGISVPYANAYGARQYVSYMSVKSWGSPGRWTTNYAGIAYSDDNGQNWTVVRSSIRSAGSYRTTTGYVSGNQNFQQSAFVRPPAGSTGGGYVYMFGTPSGRGGTVYLSRVDQATVLDQTTYEYWNGSAWVLNKPSAAKPVLPGTTTRSWFSTRTSYPSAGEMSVQYNSYLNKYLMMYADSANTVVMRTADRPEGPWSAPTPLATSAKYPGLYAPMMDPWSTGQDIYWNLSLWGDYNVLLMHTRLV